MMKPLFFIVIPGVILASGLVDGCALSPQTVDFKPLVDARSYSIGRGRELVLQVVDKRPVEHFGQRGGVYDTAWLVPGTDVAQTVHRALAERLKASNFVIRSPEVNSDLSLLVEIQAIDYLATGNPIIDTVHIHCTLQAIVRNRKHILQTQYQVDNTHRVAGPPSVSRNEELLNEALAQALRQLLQDADVLALLQQ